MALTKVKAGNILLTTPGASSNDVTPATTAYVTTALANLADSAPETLNTLNELAAALGDDANFSTTVTNSIALKAPLASPDFTGDATFDTSTLVIDSTNNRVGIGATSPAQPLHVLSNTALTAGVAKFQYSGGNDYEVIRVESLGNNDAHIGFFADGDTNYYGGFGIDYSDAGKFKLQTDNLLVGGSNLMTWDRDGKVGIGTASINANAKLHVEGAGDSQILIYETGTSPYTATLKLASQSTTDYGANVQYTSAAEQLTIENFGRSINNSTAGSIRFRTKVGNSGMQEVLHINGYTGNVGIGTDAPTQKLDVNGTVELNNLTVAGGQGTDGQVLTSTGSGVAWEDAAGATISSTAPSSPAEGDMWFNSSASTVSTIRTKSMAVWNGTAWASLSNYFSATGGTITTSGIYKIHTFTSSGTFTAAHAGTVDVFLVGGGGCGGVDIGGGGGAGGAITSASRSVAEGSHSIVVGAGAPAHSGNEGGNNNYDKGTNTTAFGLTALAGGAGGQEFNDFRDGDSGGSGGGAGYLTNTGGAGTSGQGNAGGNSSSGVAGGGGGYSQAGAAGVAGGAGGVGGDGLQNNYDGNNYWYAGGGGGNSYGGSTSGAGGKGGGGGAGGAGVSGNGTAGAGGIGRNAGTAGITGIGGAGGVNTGGGGGGGSEGNAGLTSTGGAGGSGIVIVRYIP